MSITLSQQPEDYTPAYNPMMFVAASSQIAQANFMYTVKVTDLVSSVTSTFQIPQRPDGYCVFDAAPVAKSYFEDAHYCPINVYGWKACTGIRKFRVNIGETYGSTPSYVSGANVDFIAWNGIVNYEDFPNYNPDDYVYKASSATNLVYLTNLLTDKTFEDRSNMLYALTSEVGDIVSLKIDFYNTAGVNIGTTDILNPYYTSGNYREKYLAVDVGYKGLANISSGDVSGTWPIPMSSVYYYDIYDSVITGAPPAGTLTFLKRIYVECEPVYPIYTIHYLAKNGSFETIHFHKRSDVELRKEVTSYKKIPYTFSSGTYTYSRSTPVERVLSTRRTQRIKLNTDWLDEDHVDLYQDLFDAPVVYLDLGSSQAYTQVKVVTDSYKLNKAYNEKLFQLQVDFEYAFENSRQQG